MPGEGYHASLSEQFFLSLSAELLAQHRLPMWLPPGGRDWNVLSPAATTHLNIVKSSYYLGLCCFVSAN